MRAALPRSAADDSTEGTVGLSIDAKSSRALASDTKSMSLCPSRRASCRASPLVPDEKSDQSEGKGDRARVLPPWLGRRKRVEEKFQSRLRCAGLTDLGLDRDRDPPATRLRQSNLDGIKAGMPSLFGAADRCLRHPSVIFYTHFDTRVTFCAHFDTRVDTHFDTHVQIGAHRSALALTDENTEDGVPHPERGRKGDQVNPVGPRHPRSQGKAHIRRGTGNPDKREHKHKRKHKRKKIRSPPPRSPSPFRTSQSPGLR